MTVIVQPNAAQAVHLDVQVQSRRNGLAIWPLPAIELLRERGKVLAFHLHGRGTYVAEKAAELPPLPV